MVDVNRPTYIVIANANDVVMFYNKPGSVPWQDLDEGGGVGRCGRTELPKARVVRGHAPVRNLEKKRELKRVFSCILIENT